MAVNSMSAADLMSKYDQDGRGNSGCANRIRQFVNGLTVILWIAAIWWHPFGHLPVFYKMLITIVAVLVVLFHLDFAEWFSGLGWMIWYTKPLLPAVPIGLLIGGKVGW